MQRIWLTSKGMRFVSLIIAIATGSLAFQTLTAPVGWAGDLTMAEFHALHRQLQVAPDKPWRTIPWKTSLLDAQETAARQAKPIFIWAMDGHPLGCT